MKGLILFIVICCAFVLTCMFLVRIDDHRKMEIKTENSALVTYIKNYKFSKIRPVPNTPEFIYAYEWNEIDSNWELIAYPADKYQITSLK